MLEKPMYKERKIVKNISLLKLENISQVEGMITASVDGLYEKISQRYRIDEDELYDKLYLKVRQMFIEEENENATY